ncbi:hypothetical protein CA13_30690 [Planctomycetes bacterium CA13]|uniref:Glycosyl transferase family 2 n=1 Tax=Novipirellula herctigrandis TaxID=2527986 RepID=A0A5C5Z3P1_9BACT|nr:hypothetical protein CA13_30690 [Planctomycetes bacterium CA13]
MPVAESRPLRFSPRESERIPIALHVEVVGFPGFFGSTAVVLAWSPAISLVLPAWKEIEVIVKAITEPGNALKQITDDRQIIVIVDGSTDNTGDWVERVSLLYLATVGLINLPFTSGYRGIRHVVVSSVPTWFVALDRS